MPNPYYLFHDVSFADFAQHHPNHLALPPEGQSRETLNCRHATSSGLPHLPEGEVVFKRVFKGKAKVPSHTKHSHLDAVTVVGYNFKNRINQAQLERYI